MNPYICQYKNFHYILQISCPTVAVAAVTTTMIMIQMVHIPGWTKHILFLVF